MWESANVIKNLICKVNTILHKPFRKVEYEQVAHKYHGSLRILKILIILIKSSLKWLRELRKHDQD